MTYEELLSAIRTEYRGNNTTAVANIPYYVQLTEGVIANRVRSIHQQTRVTLTDADRLAITERYYTLPEDYLDDIFVRDADNCLLSKLAPRDLNIRRNGQVDSYAITNGQIEFNKVPGEDSEFYLTYYARLAALADDDDTNALLTARPDLYQAGALYNLFKFTQDLELAKTQNDIAQAIIESLNKEAASQKGRAKKGPNQYELTTRSAM